MADLTTAAVFTQSIQGNQRVWTIAVSTVGSTSDTVVSRTVAGGVVSVWANHQSTVFTADPGILAATNGTAAGDLEKIVINRSSLSTGLGFQIHLEARR